MGPILHNPNPATGKWDVYNPETHSWVPTNRTYNQAGTKVTPTTFVNSDYGNRIGGRKSRRNIRRR
jgi:hypothetical protein